MKKRINSKWLFLLFCCPLFAQGQNISQSVIGSTGTYQTNSNGDNLHWTVGELSVELLTNGNNLSQGFHQLYQLVVEVVEVNNQSFDIKLFPNPTNGWVRLTKDSDISFKVKLTNLLGQTLFLRDATLRDNDFDISYLPNGTYFFTVFYEKQLVKTFKVTKN